MALEIRGILNRGDVEIIPVSSSDFLLDANRAPSEEIINQRLIEEGDVIIVKKGLRQILAIGKAIVRSGKLTSFDKKKGFERAGNRFNLYPNFLNVAWQRILNLKFDEDVFRQGRFGALEEIVIKRKQHRIIPLIEEEVRKTFREK